LAAKGIGQTTPSSAAVTSAVLTSHSAATTKMSTRTSSRSLASSREPATAAAAAAVGRSAVYHSEKYDTSITSSSDHVRHPALTRSSSVTSSIDHFSGYGSDITATSSYQQHPLLVRSWSSSYAAGTSAPRSSHSASTVSVAYHGHGSVTSTAPFSSDHSHGSYSAGGHARHSSRRDEHNRQQVSRLHQSAGAAPPASLTGVYDRTRRCR